ncbi:MAG TPA: heme-binding protein [Caulobacteraceae bacterium]
MTQPSAPPPAAAPAPGYGAPVSLERAKRLVAAAEAEARKHDFLMAFAIVEPSGALVAFERMDGVQYGSLEVAQAKARSAALFRRPSKAFSESVAKGAVGVLSLPGAVAVEGGVPIIVDGKIVGAIGVSGGSSEQDGAVAMAALAATP